MQDSTQGFAIQARSNEWLSTASVKASSNAEMMPRYVVLQCSITADANWRESGESGVEPPTERNIRRLEPRVAGRWPPRRAMVRAHDFLLPSNAKTGSSTTHHPLVPRALSFVPHPLQQLRPRGSFLATTEWNHPASRSTRLTDKTCAPFVYKSRINDYALPLL